MAWEFGFETGDMITVRGEEGKLIIEHRDEDILEELKWPNQYAN